MLDADQRLLRIVEQMSAVDTARRRAAVHAAGGRAATSRCGCATTSSPRPTQREANQRSAPAVERRPVPRAEGDRMSGALHELGVAAAGAGRCARSEVSSVEADAASARARGRARARWAPSWRVDDDGRAGPGARGRRAPRRRRRRRRWSACRSRTRTSSSPRELADHRRLEDAGRLPQPLRRHRRRASLAEAGTVTLGKLNCDEFAMGSSNENSAFRPVRNPWDRIARARAARRAARRRRWPRGCCRRPPAPTPAARSASRRRFCGITGIKPTYGVCSRYGMIAFASSLDQAGPLARTRRGLRAAAVGDERLRRARRDQRRAAAAGLPADARTPRDGATAARPLQGLRIGLPKEFFGDGAGRRRRGGGARGAGRVREARRDAGRRQPAAHRAVDPGLLHHRAGRGVSSNLSRFDGVRSATAPSSYGDLLDMYKKTRAKASAPRSSAAS